MRKKETNNAEKKELRERERQTDRDRDRDKSHI